MKPEAFDLVKLSVLFVSSCDISPGSRATYKNALLRFCRWCESSDVKEPARQTILSYKLWLDTHGFSSFTKSTYMVVVRRLFSWLEENDLYPDVSKGIRGAKRYIKSHQKDSLSIKAVQNLLASVDGSSLIGVRDFAIVNLLIRTGVRLKEISLATINDIEINENQMRLWVYGKGRGGKDEFVVLTKESLDPIRAYLRCRELSNSSEPLFAALSNRNYGKTMSTFALSKMVKRRLRGAGIDSKRISAHSLRHTFGVFAIKAGASLYDVQLAMRHSTPGTTEIYLGDIEKIKRAESSPEKKVRDLLR